MVRPASACTTSPEPSLLAIAEYRIDEAFDYVISHVKNHKNLGFLSNTGPDPLKITKPMMARLKWYLNPSSPHQLKKPLSKLDPLWQNFLDPRMSMTAHM